MNRPEFHDETARPVRATDIPVESLLCPKGEGGLWPESLANDAAFVEQVEQRRRLIDALAVVQSRVTDPSVALETLISNGELSEDVIADLYERLADMLERDPEYSTIVLYLPFEYLLDTQFVPVTQKLEEQAARFKAAYMESWSVLLSVHDVRANFVDGDVLETDKRTGDLPRVAKAAHMIPFLVEKGWMTADDVRSLHDGTDDAVLRRSIADTFALLHDFGVKKDHAASDGISGTALTIDENEYSTFDPAALRSYIDDRWDDIAGTADDDTAKRRAWLADTHRRTVIDEAGNDIAASMALGRFDASALEEILFDGDHVPSQSAFVDGVRKAIEHVARNNPANATELYARFREPMRVLWERGEQATRLYLEKMLFRLHHAGVIDRATLDSFGLRVPSIGGPFSENLKTMDAETERVSAILDSIRGNGVLSELVYPVVMMYGSKLKGYGAKSADSDFGVFVRQGTPDDMRADVRDRLDAVLAGVSVSDPFYEFWLREEGNGLSVRDFDSHDVALADRTSPHVLFGSSWTGDTESMRELYARLLPTYFRQTGEQMYGHDIRRVYIEALEHDVLQYRLMHKGYERYFPTRNALEGMDARSIDGHSAFWDSGYRALATKLYIERIFLPKL